MVIISTWVLSVAMETRVLILSGQNLMQPFLHHNDASNITVTDPLVSEIFVFELECEHTGAHIHGRTPAQFHAISSPCVSSAQVM